MMLLLLQYLHYPLPGPIPKTIQEAINRLIQGIKIIRNKLHKFNSPVVLIVQVPRADANYLQHVADRDVWG